MKRVLLTLWGLLCIGAAALAWPAGSQAYSHGTADGGMLALVIWQLCLVNAVGGCACIAAALCPRTRV